MKFGVYIELIFLNTSVQKKVHFFSKWPFLKGFSLFIVGSLKVINLKIFFGQNIQHQL